MPIRPALRAAPLALEPATGNAVDRVNSFLERFKQESFPALEITDGFISVLLNDPQRAREAYRRALLRSPGNPVALRLSRAVQEDGKR